MKQNIYDHPVFFESYKDLRNNDKGMNELLEQPTMNRLMRSIKGKTILDLGCGMGHQIKSLLNQEPEKIVGVDISEKMLAEAKKKVSSSIVRFVCQPVEEYDFTEVQFDLILSSMTLHYIADLKTLFQKIYASLKPQGQFLFSIEHPINTAMLQPLDNVLSRMNYAIEGSRKQDWFVKDVIKYHHKTSTIIEIALDAGFVLKNLQEPTPDKKLLERRPDFKKHIEYPPMLILDFLKL